MPPLPMPPPRGNGTLNPPVALPGMAGSPGPRLSEPSVAAAPGHVDPDIGGPVEPVATVASVTNAAEEPTP
jgi:hypothetical protein